MGVRVSRRSSVVGDVGEFVEIINVRSEKTNCTNQWWPVLACKNQVQHRELFIEQVLTQFVIEDRNAEFGDRKAKVPGGYGGKCIDYGYQGKRIRNTEQDRNEKKTMQKVDTSKYKATRTTNEGGRYGVGEGGERLMKRGRRRWEEEGGEV